MDTEHKEIHLCVWRTLKTFQEEHLFFWRVCNCVETYHRSHLDPVIQHHFNIVRQELNTVLMDAIFL